MTLNDLCGLFIESSYVTGSFEIFGKSQEVQKPK